MPYDTSKILEASRYFLAQAKSACGANAEGGGGFQLGNTCGSKDKESPASYVEKMPRSEQLARVRHALTMVKGRGLRIHTYSVSELRSEVQSLLADPFYTVIPDRKILERFAAENQTGKPKPAKSNGKVLAWAQERFKDESKARNFTEWFGNSKVVDKSGNPVVMHHKTTGVFNVFDGEQHWFTNDPEYLEEAAGAKASSEGARYIPVYLKLEKPLDMTAREGADKDFLDKLKRDTRAGKVSPENWIKEMQKAGYDGTIEVGSLQAETNEVTVFRSENIKSAIGNKGTFGAASPDITKSLAKSCGANAEGGGGFQPGNTCGKGGGAAAIDAMPRLNRNGKPKEGGDFVANQFKDSKSYNDADRALRQEAKEFGDSVSDYVKTFATEENVRLDSLESPQRILDQKSLKYFIKTKQNDDDGELPLVAQYGDAMIVLDGNHRLNAAKLRGDETSRARVIYLSEIKPKN